MPYSASCARSSSAKGYNLLLQLVDLSQYREWVCSGFRSNLLRKPNFILHEIPTSPVLHELPDRWKNQKLRVATDVDLRIDLEMPQIVYCVKRLKRKKRAFVGANQI
jgi:hypothetical protein